MSNSLRDDMMFFDGQLSALEWCFMDLEEHKGVLKLVEHMRAQYESILMRSFKDYDNE